ncbi:hypothetical protein XC55_07835, partial [Clostridioides difficile]
SPAADSVSDRDAPAHGQERHQCRRLSPGQMSLAFAISLNIEGQLNVAAGVARAIEVSVSDLDGIRAIS